MLWRNLSHMESLTFKQQAGLQGIFHLWISRLGMKPLQARTFIKPGGEQLCILGVRLTSRAAVLHPLGRCVQSKEQNGHIKTACSVLCYGITAQQSTEI